jgi:hypothetical protein
LYPISRSLLLALDVGLSGSHRTAFFQANPQCAMDLRVHGQPLVGTGRVQCVGASVFTVGLTFQVIPCAVAFPPGAASITADDRPSVVGSRAGDAVNNATP